MRFLNAPVLPLRHAVLAASLLLAPTLHAQDVVEAGRAHGVQPSASTLRILREDPEAFEFGRAWRNKVRLIRQERRRVEAASTGPMLSSSMLQAAGAAVTGTLRIPVIAGRPSDKGEPFTPAQYQARLFGEGAAGVYTAKSLYREMSRGVFTMDGTVTSWIPLPQIAAYYDPSPTTDPSYGRTFEFLRDALTGADPAMDFGQFDNDGPDGRPNSGDDDGFVDAAAFIYPSHGKACGGPGIWPHRYRYSAYNAGVAFTTNDASARGGFIRVDDYLIQGGVECDGTSLMPIGTFAHEMGHALDLPDLYDTRGATQGLGEWDLMGSGNYRTAASPAHMGAWSKDFLGWANVELLTEARTGLTLAPVYEAGRVLRYNIPGTREYFLLEHRRATGSDAFIAGPGLLVYHVDDALIDARRNSNTVNSGTLHGVDLEEADGLDQLRKQQGFDGNRGDAGDPFPGTGARTVFGDATYPASRSNAGASSGFEIRALRYTGGTLTFDVQAGSPGTPVASVTITPETATLPAGSSRQFTATLRDAGGNLLAGRPVTWTSTDPFIANVNTTGGVTATGQGGPVTISATAEGITGTAQVTVSPPVVLGTLITIGAQVPVSIPGGGEALYRLVVPSGLTRLVVTTSGGSGNGNLYVRRGGSPLGFPADCSSEGAGNAESCTFNSPAAGDWYIGIRAFSSVSGMTLATTGIVPQPPLVLGDSTTGSVSLVGGTATFPLALSAGNVIDLGAFRTGGQTDFAPYVELVSPFGTVVASASVMRALPGWILPRYTVPLTGTYTVRVRDYRHPGSQNLYTGTFRLRTRRSGVVLAMDGEIDVRFIPRGAPVQRDSVWVYNAGTAGPAPFTAQAATAAPWLAVNVLGTLAGASTEAVAPAAGPARTHSAPLPDDGAARYAAAAEPRPAPPAGAVPVEVVLTPGALLEGYYYNDVVIGIPADPWNQGLVALVDLRLHSPTARTLNATVNADPGTLARAADGQLVMASGTGLVRVDPATGALTPWVASVSTRMGGMEFGPDGSLWVADRAGNRVVRVRPDGGMVTEMTGTGPATDVAVLPDGTVYASVGNSLLRRVPGAMAHTIVLSSARTAFASSIVYNPADGWLYYGAGTALRRFNPATGVDEARGATLPASLLNLAVGRSGRLYAAENDFFGSVLVMETTGAVTGRIWGPGTGFGLVVGDGVLYGSTVVLEHAVWSMPLDDAPPVATGMSGDANGDGAITAQDALGVLSAVVGRTLPAGWDVAAGGDANCDGQVTAVDALIILSKVVSRDVSQFCIGRPR